ncbi:MAG: GHKL domain-containing protein [Lachnospiraceae bacterium]|nr:GHKL domain-containing protein [Lachnospiraceae bacterium]
MLVKVLEFITEYVGIILCIHKAAGKSIKFSWWSLLDFACWTMLVFIGADIRFGKLLPYVYLFIYTRIRVTDTWKHSIKPLCVMMCAIPILQLLLYGIISETIPDIFSAYLWGIIINTLIITFLVFWQEKHLLVLINIVTKFRKIIFIVLIFFLLKSLTSYHLEHKVIDSYYLGQIVICFLIVTLILILWINSENEKRHKIEELRTYQLYTATFEDAIAAIRMKQHEFDNHINAIKCMQYTIHDTKRLIEEQNKYCEKILQDNKYNKLLKLKTSPILVGYLYSKFTAASAHNINIEYEIQDIVIEKIAINDLIEIIGILFDNAVEAIEHQADREIDVKLIQNDNEFIISIANRSNRKINSEIEKFFEYGYSTKGDGHGIGLYRANALSKKYKAYIQVENVNKYDKNYLCFKVVFNRVIKGIA